MVPSVSIIMPSYNCKEYISFSIQSVREQTYTDWELLIVDDHSTDGTVEVLKEWEKVEERIRVFTERLMEERLLLGIWRSSMRVENILPF